MIELREHDAGRVVGLEVREELAEQPLVVAVHRLGDLERHVVHVDVVAFLDHRELLPGEPDEAGGGRRGRGRIGFGNPGLIAQVVVFAEAEEIELAVLLRELEGRARALDAVGHGAVGMEVAEERAPPGIGVHGLGGEYRNSRQRHQHTRDPRELPFHDVTWPNNTPEAYRSRDGSLTPIVVVKGSLLVLSLIGDRRTRHFSQGRECGWLLVTLERPGPPGGVADWRLTAARRGTHTGSIDSDTPDITALLRAWQGGDDDAYRQVSALLYTDLKRRAAQCLRGETATDGLHATALVHEAFIRLTTAQGVDWQDRLHFLAVATRTMRRVLVDLVRARAASKRGSRPVHVTLDSQIPRASLDVVDVLALDAALEKLARIDARRVSVVELRYFGGLTVPETAAVLQVAPDTVARDWRLARAWLKRELNAPSAR